MLVMGLLFSEFRSIHLAKALIRLFQFVFFFSSRRRHTRWNCDWSSHVCSYDLLMRRRDLLAICGIGAGAYVIGARAAPPASRSPRRLICVFVTGGWDTTYALDPKDPAYAAIPAGAVRNFEGLDIFVDDSRPGVTTFFERHAGATALVRGISTDAINHNECQRRIATGTREDSRPDRAAIVAHDLGNDLPLPYLILGDTAWTGPYTAS